MLKSVTPLLLRKPQLARSTTLLAARSNIRVPSASRLFASNTSSHNHGHGNKEGGKEKANDNSTIYWLLGSIVLFGPLSYYITGSDSSSSSTASSTKQKTANYLDNRDAQRRQSSPCPPGVSHFTYVLVGGGTAAFNAMEAIKMKDPKAQILMIAEEDYVPYQRPPLSKELWFSKEDNVAETLKFKNWQGVEASLFYKPDSEFEMITLDSIRDGSAAKMSRGNKPKYLKGTKATKLNVEEQLLELNDGTQVHYDKILLATGGTPKSLTAVEKLPKDVRSHVTTYRSVNDFKNLDEVARDGKKIVVIGGGFLGSELTCALAQRIKPHGLSVTQIFPEEGNMSLVFPRYLTRWTTSRLENEGVSVKPNSSIDAISKSQDGKLNIKLKSGENVEADHIVLAVGLHPNIDMAEKAGLEIDEKRNGIVVNAELEARTNVFAAGDNTSFHDIALGRRRVEHYDHAVMSGKLAGENMAAASPYQKKPYTYQSMFWSDLGPEIAYEAVGLIDSALSTVGVWAKVKKPEPVASSPDAREEYGKGIVFYMKEKKIVGVLMWNMLNRVDLARKIIKDGKRFDDINELAGLFNVHE